MNCSAGGTCGFIGIAPFTATNSAVLTGFSVGCGVDVKPAANWSARGECRYSDYGTWRTVVGNPATLAVTTDIRTRTHTALFVLAYALTGLGQLGSTKKPGPPQPRAPGSRPQTPTVESGYLRQASISAFPCPRRQDDRAMRSLHVRFGSICRPQPGPCPLRSSCYQ